MAKKDSKKVKSGIEIKDQGYVTLRFAKYL